MYIFECKLALDPSTEFTQRLMHLPDEIRPGAINEVLVGALEGANRVKQRMDIESLDMNVNQFDYPIYEFMSIDVEHAQRYAQTLFPYFEPESFDNDGFVPVAIPKTWNWEWHGMISDPGPIEVPDSRPLPMAQPQYEHVDVPIDIIWALQKDHIILFLTAAQVDQMSDGMKLAYFDKVCHIAYEAHLLYVTEEMENELTGSRNILVDPDKELSAER